MQTAHCPWGQGVWVTPDLRNAKDGPDTKCLRTLETARPADWPSQYLVYEKAYLCQAGHVMLGTWSQPGHLQPSSTWKHTPQQ